MADITRSGAGSWSLESSLEEAIRCPVCLTTMLQPRTLTCAHKVCLSCLEGLVQTGPDHGEIQCPTCRKTIQLGTEGVDSIPTDPLVNDVQDILAQTPSNDSKCTVCRSNKKFSKAEFWCQQCGIHLCLECKEEHNQKPILQGHQVTELTTCTRHAHHTLEYFCSTCQLFVCSICVLGSCKGHQCLVISDQSLAIIKGQIQTFIKEKDEEINKASEHFKEILQQNLEKATTQAEEYFNNLVAKLEEVANIPKSTMEAYNEEWKHEMNMVTEVLEKIDPLSALEPNTKKLFNKLKMKTMEKECVDIVEMKVPKNCVEGFEPKISFAEFCSDSLKFMEPLHAKNVVTGIEESPGRPGTSLEADELNTGNVEQQENITDGSEAETNDDSYSIISNQTESSEETTENATNETTDENHGNMAENNEQETQNNDNDNTPTNNTRSVQLLYTIRNVNKDIVAYDNNGNLLVQNLEERKFVLHDASGNVIPSRMSDLRHNNADSTRHNNADSTPTVKVRYVKMLDSFAWNDGKKIHFQKLSGCQHHTSVKLRRCDYISSFTISETGYITGIGEYRYPNMNEDLYRRNRPCDLGMGTNDISGRSLGTRNAVNSSFDVEHISDNRVAVSRAFNQPGLAIYKMANGWLNNIVDDSLGHILGLAVDSNGRIWACDHSNGCVQVISPDGNGRVTCPQVVQLNCPTSIAVHGTDRFAVTHFDNGGYVASVYQI